MAGVKIPVLQPQDMLTERDKPMYAMGRLSALGRIYGTPVPFAVRHPALHGTAYKVGGLSLGALVGLVLGSMVDKASDAADESSLRAGTLAGTGLGGLAGLLIASKRARETQFRAADKVSDELRMSPLPPDASAFTRALLERSPEEGESNPVLERMTGTRAFSRGKRDAYRQFLARGDRKSALTDMVDDSR